MNNTNGLSPVETTILGIINSEDGDLEMVVRLLTADVGREIVKSLLEACAQAKEIRFLDEIVKITEIKLSPVEASGIVLTYKKKRDLFPAVLFASKFAVPEDMSESLLKDSLQAGYVACVKKSLELRGRKLTLSERNAYVIKLVEQKDLEEAYEIALLGVSKKAADKLMMAFMERDNLDETYAVARYVGVTQEKLKSCIDFLLRKKKYGKVIELTKLCTSEIKLESLLRIYLRRGNIKDVSLIARLLKRRLSQDEIDGMVRCDDFHDKLAVAKLGASQPVIEWVFNLYLKGRYHRDAVKVAVLGVRQSMLDNLLCACLGVGDPDNAIKVAELGASQEKIDLLVTLLNAANRDWEAIKVAKSGASVGMRKILLDKALDRGDFTYASLVVGIEDRELSSDEIVQLVNVTLSKRLSCYVVSYVKEDMRGIKSFRIFVDALILSMIYKTATMELDKKESLYRFISIYIDSYGVSVGIIDKLVLQLMIEDDLLYRVIEAAELGSSKKVLEQVIELCLKAPGYIGQSDDVLKLIKLTGREPESAELETITAQAA